MPNQLYMLVYFCHSIVPCIICPYMVLVTIASNDMIYIKILTADLMGTTSHLITLANIYLPQEQFNI